MNLDVTNRVIDLIARVHKVSHAEVIISQSLEELGMDSFDAINLFFAIEEEFDIALPEEAKDYRSIGDIILGVETLLNESLVLEG